MAKLHLFVLLVLFALVQVGSSCYDNDDCLIGHCCEDNACYRDGVSCPIVNKLAGGVVVAIIISVIVVVGIIVAIIACCCCACCPGYRGSPGQVVVTQTPYQNFGANVVVQNSTNTVQQTPQPPPQYHPQGPPAYPQQGYPQQGYPPNYNQQPPKY